MTANVRNDESAHEDRDEVLPPPALHRPVYTVRALNEYFKDAEKTPRLVGHIDVEKGFVFNRKNRWPRRFVYCSWKTK